MIQLLRLKVFKDKTGHFNNQYLCYCGKVFYKPPCEIKVLKSCGCYRREKVRVRNLKHGNAVRKQTTTEYYIWNGMIRRCHNPKNKDYQRYGGRGIQVCERWRRDFSAFLVDMGPRPPNKSIDRINNDGNYEPLNCRWATAKEQRQNTRPRKRKK